MQNLSKSIALCGDSLNFYSGNDDQITVMAALGAKGVISVLSNKTSDELSTPTGKEIAKEEILEMVNNIFEGQRDVIKVNFYQFIIQAM